MPGGAVTQRQDDRAAVADALDLALEDLELGWIDDVVG
jgi:hypothetical protein